MVRGKSVAESISILTVNNEGQLIQRLAEEYVSPETGIDIDLTLYEYERLFDETRSILGGRAAAYDVLLIDDPWFPLFATHFDPIERWLPEGLPEQQFIQPTLDVVEWPPPRGPIIPRAEDIEPRRRGVVLVGNSQLFGYNPTLYEQVGASKPQRWEDVYRAGQKITDSTEDRYGFAIRGEPANPINSHFYSLCMTEIGNMFDSNWRYQWNTTDGVDTLSFYVNDLKSISPPGVHAFDSEDILPRLVGGNVAAATVWPGEASVMVNSLQDGQAIDIEFMQPPAGMRHAPLQGNWIAGINSYTSKAKKRAAGRVLQSCISFQAQNRYVDFGGIPFRHDTFQENMNATPWMSALYESLQNTKWRSRTPLWNSIANRQGEFVSRALIDNLTPSSALDRTESAIETILADAGYYDTQ